MQSTVLLTFMALIPCGNCQDLARSSGSKRMDRLGPTRSIWNAGVPRFSIWTGSIFRVHFFAFGRKQTDDDDRLHTINPIPFAKLKKLGGPTRSRSFNGPTRSHQQSSEEMTLLNESTSQENVEGRYYRNSSANLVRKTDDQLSRSALGPTWSHPKYDVSVVCAIPKGRSDSTKVLHPLPDINSVRYKVKTSWPSESVHHSVHHSVHTRSLQIRCFCVSVQSSTFESIEWEA